VAENAHLRLVFIDADKASTAGYFAQALRLSRRRPQHGSFGSALLM